MRKALTPISYHIELRVSHILVEHLAVVGNDSLVHISSRIPEKTPRKHIDYEYLHFESFFQITLYQYYSYIQLESIHFGTFAVPSADCPYSFNYNSYGVRYILENVFF